MNNSSNISQPAVQHRGPKYEEIPQVVPIAVLIILTNGVVFYLFGKMKSLRTPANYFLLSLAISDIMTGLINIPLFLGLLQLSSMPSVFLVVYCISEVFHNVISFSIAYHITAITVDKYLAVVNPFGRFLMTKKTVMKILSAVWLCSAFLGTLPAIWWDSWIAFDSIALHLQAGYNIFCLFIVFFVPYIFILYAYGVMFKAVSSKRRLKASPDQKYRRAFKKANNEKKCLIILLAMAITFAVCWIPWFTLKLIYSFSAIGWINIEDPASMKKAAQTFVIIRYISSAINPLLYTFFKQDFWSAFKIVILKRHPRRPSMRLTTQRIRGNEQHDELKLLAMHSIVKTEQSTV